MNSLNISYALGNIFYSSSIRRGNQRRPLTAPEEQQAARLSTYRAGGGLPRCLRGGRPRPSFRAPALRSRFQCSERSAFIWAVSRQGTTGESGSHLGLDRFPDWTGSDLETGPVPGSEWVWRKLGWSQYDLRCIKFGFKSEQGGYPHRR